MARNVFTALVLLGASFEAFAADGTLEINQACAQVGCFAGDTAGFPVTITGAAGTSYLLTSDLNLASEGSGTHGVQISGAYVTLDLNGFSIIGPNSCTGTGAALSCTFAAGGNGVNIVDPAYGVTVKNGTLRNMAGFGAQGVGRGHHFERLTARHNGGDGVGMDGYAMVSWVKALENGEDGIDADLSSIVENCIASGNKDDGVELDSHGALVRATVARGNGQRGFNVLFDSSEFGGDNVSSSNAVADNCGGGTCTSLRRYYLTTSTHNGANALVACDLGFHMASLWELIQTSNLLYDHFRGETEGDSGFGPPTSLNGIGWARTGIASSVSFAAQPGSKNCNAWTVSGSGQYGSGARLSPVWSDFGGDVFNRVVPWLGLEFSCDSTLRVWCIED